MPGTCLPSKLPSMAPLNPEAKRAMVDDAMELRRLRAEEEPPVVPIVLKSKAPLPVAKICRCCGSSIEA